MSTIPTRHHGGGEVALTATVISLLAALFVLFEGSILWMAVVVAFIALLPLPLPVGGERLETAARWRFGAAAAMAVTAVLIWLA